MFRYTVFALLPLLALAGCGREPIPSREAGIPDHCIEITLNGIQPVLSTKATSEGEDAYNENLVESVDCFFYPDGGTGSNAVFMALGRGAEAVTEGSNTVYKVKVFFTDADANRMFGSTVSGTCKLYVICNAPLSYDVAHTSVDELKEQVVENDFTAQTVQGSFVMSADETATVTLTTEGENRTASGRINVSRSSAKIQFFLLIPDEFEDEAHQIWEPVLEAGISISMSNAVKRGKVDGEYAIQSSDYVSYGPRVLTALPAGSVISGYEDYKYTHVPFYSYPCAWSDLSDYASSVVFRIPWRIKGETNYQWKKYQLSPNVSTLDLKRNTYYRTFVKVSSLGGADKESLVIIPECDYEIIPWMNEGATGGGQGIVPGELITYKYLVMDHPEQTINNEPTVYFSYVSSSPVASITITKVDYYDNRNSTPRQTEPVNRTITAGSETFTVNQAVGSITVNKENPGYVTLHHSLDNMYSPITVYATVTNEDGCTQDIVFVQNPSISLECFYGTNKGDVFVDGFFNRVANSPFGTRWQNNTNPGRDDLYYYSYSGNVPTHYSVGNQTVNGTTYNYTNYGSISKGKENNENPIFTTEINVTSFNTGNNTFTYELNGVRTTVAYRIGDPRVKASSTSFASDWSLYPYLYWNGTASAFDYWKQPEDIMVTSTDRAMQDVIAPRFLVSSNLNGQGTKANSFLNTVKRAAVYQEAGYPAGRWRLPTEAEVAFMYAREQDETIPSLFGGSSGYYVASGLHMKKLNAGDTMIKIGAPEGGPSARFVYDLWYWGDEPTTTNVYHPNGHLYNYDSAGNATPIR